MTLASIIADLEPLVLELERISRRARRALVTARWLHELDVERRFEDLGATERAAPIEDDELPF